MKWNWLLPIVAIAGLFKFHLSGKEALFKIFLFCTLVLLFFSVLVSFMVNRKERSGGELMARTITFWWMELAFMLSVSTHRLVSYGLIFLISTLALYEYFSFFASQPKPRSERTIQALIYLMIPLNLSLHYMGHGDDSGVLILATMILGLVPLIVLSNKTDNTSKTFGKYALALSFFVYALGTAGTLINVDVVFLLTCVIITELRDLVSYWVGKLFAKIAKPHNTLLNLKIADRVSPNKTWAVGLVSIALLMFMAALASDSLRKNILAGQLSMGQLQVWIFAVGLSGLFGDLALSLVKREFGVKDSGRLLPGAVGAIDRIDSLIFTFPVSYLMLKYYFRF